MSELSEPLKRLVASCSLPVALEAMGERWSFLILLSSFNGLCHFEEFQQRLGIARNILSNRLGRLVERGILERSLDTEDRRRVTYRLTEKGQALLPALIALRQWGERWGSCAPVNPVLVDLRDGKPVQPVSVRAHDGRVLGSDDLGWRDMAKHVSWPLRPCAGQVRDDERADSI
jgi:DNA-binding HxlR family transcriptional regulator